jgi:hypothetical protein
MYCYDCSDASDEDEGCTEHVCKLFVELTIIFFIVWIAVMHLMRMRAVLNMSANCLLS